MSSGGTGGHGDTVSPPPLSHVRPSRPPRIRANGWVIFLLVMAAVFWLYRLVKVLCSLLSYWEIRAFYIKALNIPSVSGAGRGAAGTGTPRGPPVPRWCRRARGDPASPGRRTGCATTAGRRCRRG